MTNSNSSFKLSNIPFAIFTSFTTLLQKMVGKIETKRHTQGRTIATFKLRSQEMAAVRLLLAQGKSNEALTYMQGLSSATKQ